MRVFKFGGASINSANGVRNLKQIVVAKGGAGCERGAKGGLFVIISAMGKSTNALEQVVEAVIGGDRDGAHRAFDVSEKYHTEIAQELMGDVMLPEELYSLFRELRELIDSSEGQESEYDLWYDRIVPYGELLSTTIVSSYLSAQGVNNRWLDMRQLFITDDRHRDANIDLELSEPLLKGAVQGSDCDLFIGQGFIGATRSGDSTTLGREGSDYSAAVAAYILEAESVTIWKDVEGVLNADPRLFSDTVLIPELSYLDAVELAYSGAQIIHPKTIKPLQNRDIPLYVRPFSNMDGAGSVIRSGVSRRIDVPILILKHNQVLLSISPSDFSFMIEDQLASIFILLEKYRIKVNLIQSSAINLSLSVDNSRLLPDVVQRLTQRGYRVAYNSNMELLTIRGYTDELYQQQREVGKVYLTQETRRMVRLVRKVI